MQSIPLRRFVWVQLKTVHSVYRLVRKCPWFPPKEGGVSDLHSNLHSNYAAKPVAMAPNLQRCECALPRRAKIKPAGFPRYSRSRPVPLRCHGNNPYRLHLWNQGGGGGRFERWHWQPHWHVPQH
jgi:hypothetical protein